MASVDSAPVAQLPNPTPQRRRPRRGGHNPPAQRGGQNLGSVTQIPETNGSTTRAFNNPALALRPASVAPSPNPSSAEPSSAEASANENGHLGNARGRGRSRRGRGRGTGGGGEVRGVRGPAGASGTDANGQSYGHHGLHNGHNQGTTPGSGRQFGGALTQEEPTSPQTVFTLQADAPEFHPGQQHQQRLVNPRGGKAARTNHRQPQIKAPRARRQSIPKSTAPDIATRTHEDIASGIYECPICTNEVARNSKVWSCKTCWTLRGEMTTETFRLQDNGDVLAAICPKTFCPLLTRVGARRKRTLNQSLAYRLIRVVKLVATIGFFQSNALIPASYYVMPVHVLLVHISVPSRVAFAARSRPRGDA
ncbi:hypothetical protein IMSHALPRED_010161 [Imshaugia aleurites]|uniref:Uncharacterized protein n=1 Tax=Imshaugia aleurites TaxID=172621 RepID=A0A8H3IP80_9LECA|nr:hypothetical protein IMSHALPRED_010161 [Imshaugia aleurites]